MSTLDRSGRVRDRIITAALGWQPGDRLVLTVRPQLIEIRRDTTGLTTLTSRGYLPVPAAARRRATIGDGERVLLAAQPATDRLTIYPLSAGRARRPDHPHCSGGTA